MKAMNSLATPRPGRSFAWLCAGVRLASGAAVAAAVLLAGAPARADYPIVSHRYLADPAALVVDGRVYLYNSNDDDNAEEGGYSMHSIVCVSSSDLKNWTDHGIVFQVPDGASWATNSWAPQPALRDGTIYLYFGDGAAGVGVATSTSPIGPFEDARGSALVNSSTPGAPGPDIWLFDPGVLIDDDGAAYLAFGGNGVSNARIIRLGSDLTSVTGSAMGFSPPGFYEASFFFKRGDIYYFAYSTNPDNGLRIDYLTSSSPDTGYTYRGVIADQPPINENNNHASQFVLNGQWYHAYHNRIVSTQAGIPTTYKRNLAIEVLNFETDGSIQEVVYTTDGVPQVGRIDPYTRVEAETTNAQRGIETETCSEGGMNVTAIQSGDWLRVRGVDFTSAGAETFTARVASNMAGGAIELRLDQVDGALAGTCTVPNTGGPQMWATTECPVTGATGVKDLYLAFTGGGFNLDSWQFTPVGGGTGGTGGAGGGGNAGQAGAAGSLAGAAPNGGTGGMMSGGSGGTLPNAGTMNGGGTNGGTTASGGAAGAGTGGSLSTGGTLGSGGSAGRPASGGSSGTAPSAGMSSGGAAGTASPSAGAGGGHPSDESGCGCRVAKRGSGATALALFGLLALSGLRRARRRAVGR
jgi:arabinoxylan arabinofuranohydrolase